MESSSVANVNDPQLEESVRQAVLLQQEQEMQRTVEQSRCSGSRAPDP